jgi:hypothetical protein
MIRKRDMIYVIYLYKKDTKKAPHMILLMKYYKLQNLKQYILKKRSRHKSK